MINKVINTYRKKIAKNNLINNLCDSFVWLIILVFILACIESVFYLETNMRHKIFSIIFSLITTFLLYSTFKFSVTHFGLFNNYNNIKISKIIGEKHQSIKDELTNIIQIQQLQNVDKNLIKLAEKNLNNKLSDINSENINEKTSKTKILQTLFYFFIFTFLVFTFNFKEPLYRIINFNKNFNPPLPFTLHSKFGNFSSLEGDSIYINIY